MTAAWMTDSLTLRRSRRAALQHLGRGGLVATLGAFAGSAPSPERTASALAATPATPVATQTTDLTYLPATEALALFRARQLSPIEVLDAQIARIEARNPAVNAITFAHLDEARAAARESERRYLRGEARVLEGITVGVKDDQSIAGMITTYGSVLF